MGFAKEFKTFAMRGNVMDMAVGIVIGAAFGKIVTSLVNDVIMPPVGVLLGGVDFSRLAVTLKPAAEGAPAVVLNYGMFVNTIIELPDRGLRHLHGDQGDEHFEKEAGRGSGRPASTPGPGDAAARHQGYAAQQGREDPVSNFPSRSNQY